MSEGNWSLCSLCNEVVSENSLAVCPSNSGGRHLYQKVKFSLGITSSPSDHSKDSAIDLFQPGWNKCGRCYGVYYSSLPGVCHDGKPHVKLGNDYWLPMSSTFKNSDTNLYTTGFKLCTNCTVLCNGSINGCASSTGKHMYANMGYYSLLKSSSIPAEQTDMKKSVLGMTYVGPYFPPKGMTMPKSGPPSNPEIPKQNTPDGERNSSGGWSSTQIGLAVGIPVAVIIIGIGIWLYRRSRNRVYASDVSDTAIIPE